MISEFKLKLRSPFLGSEIPGNGGIRKIAKDVNGLVLLDRELIRLNLEIARQTLKMRVNVKEGVNPPCRLLPAQTFVFRRTYGASRSELFEIYRSGTVLTLAFDLLKIPQAPTEAQLRELLGWVGQHLGISQFGAKFGYGRFQVLPDAYAMDNGFAS